MFVCPYVIISYKLHLPFGSLPWVGGYTGEGLDSVQKVGLGDLPPVFIIQQESLYQLHGERHGHVVQTVLHRLWQVKVILLHSDQTAPDQAVNRLQVKLVLFTTLDQASSIENVTIIS